jgi:hypothetical protein
MNKILGFVMIIFSSNVYGQIENRWQPDTVYQNRKVKRILSYLNSPKDLDEIVEFGRDGFKTRVIKYSASYNSKTRKYKRIEMISYYKYDANKKLIQITDSSYNLNNTYYFYDSTGRLITSKYFRGSFKDPDYETSFSYEPFKATTIQRIDSLIVYNKAKEFNNDFYVKRLYGYYLDPKLKTGFLANNGDTSSYQYSDYKDRQRFDDEESITNNFDSNGRLLSSEVKSVFMNNRHLEYKLIYEYFPNGLLKNIHGYEGRYFKYEFYK